VCNLCVFVRQWKVSLSEVANFGGSQNDTQDTKVKAISGLYLRGPLFTSHLLN